MIEFLTRFGFNFIYFKFKILFPVIILGELKIHMKSYLASPFPKTCFRNRLSKTPHFRKHQVANQFFSVFFTYVSPENLRSTPSRQLKNLKWKWKTECEYKTNSFLETIPKFSFCSINLFKVRHDLANLVTAISLLLFLCELLYHGQGVTPCIYEDVQRLRITLFSFYMNICHIESILHHKLQNLFCPFSMHMSR